MKCRSARINAGSFAANSGLRGASVAVIPGRKSAGMLVGPVSNAGHYSYDETMPSTEKGKSRDEGQEIRKLSRLPPGSDPCVGRGIRMDLPGGELTP
jgi:hypothetical protein